MKYRYDHTDVNSNKQKKRAKISYAFVAITLPPFFCLKHQ